MNFWPEKRALGILSRRQTHLNIRGLMSEVLLLIPARFASGRFPGKPLANIASKTMIEHVVDNCLESKFDYAVVTDDERIENHLKDKKLNVVRVDDDVPSGSERIALAYERYFKNKDYKLVINIQGDEPLLKADEIKKIANFHLDNSFFDIVTMIKPRKSTDEDYKNPNVVKCIFAENTKTCLNFTRASSPYSRDGGEFTWHQHIGVYSYLVKALTEFVKLPSSRLEKLESLEQLRALENNYKIGAITTDVTLFGVDVPEDIKKVEGVLGVKTK